MSEPSKAEVRRKVARYARLQTILHDQIAKHNAGFVCIIMEDDGYIQLIGNLQPNTPENIAAFLDEICDTIKQPENEIPLGDL